MKPPRINMLDIYDELLIHVMMRVLGLVPLNETQQRLVREAFSAGVSEWAALLRPLLCEKLEITTMPYEALGEENLNFSEAWLEMFYRVAWGMTRGRTARRLAELRIRPEQLTDATREELLEISGITAAMATAILKHRPIKQYDVPTLLASPIRPVFIPPNREELLRQYLISWWLPLPIARTLVLSGITLNDALMMELAELDAYLGEEQAADLLPLRRYLEQPEDIGRRDHYMGLIRSALQSHAQERSLPDPQMSDWLGQNNVVMRWQQQIATPLRYGLYVQLNGLRPPYHVSIRSLTEFGRGVRWMVRTDDFGMIDVSTDMPDEQFLKLLNLYLRQGFNFLEGSRTHHLEPVYHHALTMT